ncbi:MAG: 3-deoxy-manno-octulosonate cytidylyltransferase [Bacteroidota bacterium]|nr:3-deoxy-manno-octulosonate cytidylyltransferase [Bacteroidota bacterium]
MSTKSEKVYAIIPARFASTRLPGKPLVDLTGKSMIQRVYEQAKKAKLVNEVIVATDDSRIEEVVKSFNGKVVMTPKDIKSGSDRIAFVAKNLDDADIIVNVQGDEPLLSPEMIDEAVLPLLQDDSIEVATLVKVITDESDLKNPNVPKVVLNDEGYAVYFSRSPIPYFREEGNHDEWLKSHTYYKHIGLYVFRKKFLLMFTSWRESLLERAEKLEQLRIIENGFKIKAVVTKYESIPVDTPEDVERIKQILERTKGNKL